MDIPRQVDRRVRDEILALPVAWRVVKKRDHYFLYVGDERVCCIANNSSKTNEFLVRRTVEKLRRYQSNGHSYH